MKGVLCINRKGTFIPYPEQTETNRLLEIRMAEMEQAEAEERLAAVRQGEQNRQMARLREKRDGRSAHSAPTTPRSHSDNLVGQAKKNRIKAAEEQQKANREPLRVRRGQSGSQLGNRRSSLGASPRISGNGGGKKLA